MGCPAGLAQPPPGIVFSCKMALQPEMRFGHQVSGKGVRSPIGQHELYHLLFSPFPVSLFTVIINTKHLSSCRASQWLIFNLSPPPHVITRVLAKATFLGSSKRSYGSPISRLISSDFVTNRTYVAQHSLPFCHSESALKGVNGNWASE